MKKNTEKKEAGNRKPSSRDVLVQSAVAYIETHSAEHFSLQKMAGELFVNGSYLLRAFKRGTGCTPLAYHHRVRCEKAKDMLEHSEKSISEVGEAAGFVSSSHFAHIFKKTVGCTPTEYRINHRVYWENEENKA